MNDYYCPDTPAADIAAALIVECDVGPKEAALYLECLNNKPMSQRKTKIEIRAGCILTNHVFLVCRKKYDKPTTRKIKSKKKKAEG